MARKPLYINSPGILKREGNTLYFVNKEGKKAVPIQMISTIYAMNKISLRSGALDLCFEHNIPIHIFNKYGFYKGSIFPKDFLVSGEIVIRQAEHHLNHQERLYIATQFVKGCRHNMLKVLTYYYNRDHPKLKPFIDQLRKLALNDSIYTIDQIRAYEGQLWKLFYQTYNIIIKNPDFHLVRRQYNPPPDPLNALISYLNALLYTTTLSEIFYTYLHPAISFLHEPHSRRYSLALDLADLFKPIYVTRILFKLINKKIITLKDFDSKIKVHLKEAANKKVIQHFDSFLNTTFKHPQLKRKVSYRHIIRLECYKLVKHFLGEKKYKPFQIQW